LKGLDKENGPWGLRVYSKTPEESRGRAAGAGDPRAHFANRKGNGKDEIRGLSTAAAKAPPPVEMTIFELGLKSKSNGKDRST
jgi:hypothetical protein